MIARKAELNGASRPTIRDVANAAGVSTATVSNVLRKTRFVRPERRKKVLDAIASLGYSPNLIASGLRARRSRMVGIVVPDITTSFFGSIVRRIEELASGSDYQILLVDTQEDAEREYERVRALIRHQADGLIFIPCADSRRTLAEIRRSEIPTIIVDRSEGGRQFDSIAVDNLSAARQGCCHLLSLGHRRIVFLASEPRLRNISDRIKGYCAAMKDAGLGHQARVLIGGMSSDLGRAAVQRVLQMPHPPSAIFASTHVMALGALRAVWEAGLEVPQTVSVLAFDDCDWMTALRPFLSTIRQPIEAIAQEAWSVLNNRLQRRDIDRVYRELPCSLIVRESTARAVVSR